MERSSDVSPIGRTATPPGVPLVSELGVLLGALRLAARARQVPRVPLPELIADMVRLHPRVRTSEPAQAVRAAARACSRLARWGRGLDTCLTRSLVAGVLLGRAHDVVLHLGFRPPVTQGTATDGHAWLQVGPTRVEPAGRDPDAVGPYTPLASFPIRDQSEGMS